MVGDDAMAWLGLALGGNAGERHRGRDQRLEQVDLVIVVGALQHGGDALKPHAGVDRGMRQGNTLIGGNLLVLHEDEIPDLDEAVALGVRTAGRAALHARAMVVENLRARTAGTKLAHRPEIVRACDADDLLVGEASDLPPQRRCLIVVGVDGDQQALLVELKVLGEQLPGEQDRLLLEIVAEGEIAEHLEEGVMARGVADIVEVVVLAAGAHALLRRGCARERPLFLSGENILERHHAGIGEHQRRIVARHERRRWHDLMVALGEEIEEAGADGVGAGIVDAAYDLTRGVRVLDARVDTRVGGTFVVHAVPADLLLWRARAGGFLKFDACLSTWAHGSEARGASCRGDIVAREATRRSQTNPSRF